MKVKNYHAYLSILGILTLFVSGIICAKDGGDCELIDENNNTITTSQWYRGIDLEPIGDIQKEGTILLRYKIKNHDWIVNVYHNNQENKHYLDVDTIEGDPHSPDCKDECPYDLVISIGTTFDTYENYETSTVLKFRVNFECLNKKHSEIEFRIPIIDSNNHDPEFLDDSYKFTLPMPIPKGIFTEKITLRDVDLTNNQISLRFDENEHSKGRFLISPGSQDPQNKKKYLPRIISSSIIDLEDDITFTLFATDSGNPPRTINTTVNIIVDQENSYPRFSQPLYTADLTKVDVKKADKISVEFVEGNITVTRGYQLIDNITIKGCSDENAKHFKLIHPGGLSKHGLVTIVEVNDLSEKFLKQKVITVVLSASTGHIEITTILQILLPEIPNDKLPEKDCRTSEKENTSGSIVDVDNENGYMVATILLSLVCTGLMGFIVFLILKKETGRVRF